jgi:hypothetical protein
METKPKPTDTFAMAVSHVEQLDGKPVAILDHVSERRAV